MNPSGCINVFVPNTGIPIKSEITTPKIGGFRGTGLEKETPMLKSPLRSRS